MEPNGISVSTSQFSQVHTLVLLATNLRGQFVRTWLARLSHLEGFAGVKSFRISEGYPKVFTTGKGVGTLF